jgi:two-component system phosphate regulon response regulator OmpR
MAIVLVVDDDFAAVEIRKLVLERHGHIVVTATDAGSARAIFVENIPDVVITDLRLPDPEDGLALIRELRAEREHLKIIVLCGNSADIEGREEAAMVDAILTKPVRSEALLTAIRMSASF